MPPRLTAEKRLLRWASTAEGTSHVTPMKKTTVMRHTFVHDTARSSSYRSKCLGSLAELRPLAHAHLQHLLTRFSFYKMRERERPNGC